MMDDSYLNNLNEDQVEYWEAFQAQLAQSKANSEIQELFRKIERYIDKKDIIMKTLVPDLLVTYTSHHSEEVSDQAKQILGSLHGNFGILPSDDDLEEGLDGSLEGNFDLFDGIKEFKQAAQAIDEDNKECSPSVGQEIYVDPDDTPAPASLRSSSKSSFRKIFKTFDPSASKSRIKSISKTIEKALNKKSVMQKVYKANLSKVCFNLLKGDNIKQAILDKKVEEKEYLDYILSQQPVMELSRFCC